MCTSTDVVSVGYKEFDTGRTYLATMGDRNENKHVEVELDGVGGVSILVKADVHRSGSNHISLLPPLSIP